ncbi:cytochrome c oxidase subunit 3 [Altererythrobacter xixiisoli]|uniref:Cytochrome c oxidase subunit 3 n=1 Tax=Croceibacterium xixiisoli TaxID=1476466 RepID=A0A6I4TYC6_9SPHN|nr:cytochrome c oxidase subunit 3 [Croceibacterium xixiisoli]MXO99648.1 cytochrome c oxidase subunit 3 [Croceibacterium xixiisoli]
MAGAKNHDYHILPTDIWPFIMSMSALVFTSGMVLYMHEMPYGHFVTGLGVAGLIAAFFSWFSNITKEAQAGDHTPVVQLHLRYAMILFIASEVMFFVGWFWAFFDFALFPNALEQYADVVGGQFPPKAIEAVMDPFGLPLLNTLILLCSGTTLTWSHHSLIHGDRDSAKTGLWLTIALGVLFSFIQAYEYMHAPFGFGGNTYSSAFYMATGFHGFHVIIGTIFLIVCLVRLNKGHFTPRQHFGFEAAAWYWHFVDVVWLFLFVTVYIWGGWGAAIH